MGLLGKLPVHGTKPVLSHDIFISKSYYCCAQTPFRLFTPLPLVAVQTACTDDSSEYHNILEAKVSNSDGLVVPHALLKGSCKTANQVSGFLQLNTIGYSLCEPSHGGNLHSPSPVDLVLQRTFLSRT